MGKIAILVHLLAASTSAGFQNCSLLTNPVAPIGKNAMGSIFRQQCGVDVSEFTNVWQKKLMIEETHNSTDPPLVLLMMGDSTMWQQYETLIMMTGAISFGGPAKTHDRPLSSTHMDYHGVELELRAATVTVAGRRLVIAIAVHHLIPFPIENCSTIADHMLASLRKAATSAPDTPGRDELAGVTAPDYVYASAGGLHSLHLHPWARWDGSECSGCRASPFKIAAFVHIEDRIRTGFDALTAAHPRVRRGYFTTHAVCEGRYVKDFESAAVLYSTPESVPRQCVERLAIFPGLAEGDDARRDLCFRGAMTRRGSKDIRARELAALGAARFADVDIVDGFAITDRQCWASAPEDGRHYPALIPLEVTALLHSVLGE